MNNTKNADNSEEAAKEAGSSIGKGLTADVAVAVAVNAGVAGYSWILSTCL
ncbi:hypothetical protein [Paenibacillus sp. FSL H8-0259]|uniref:hypothetical protein n=1 Tax=Paenibacillus sp. FSL H8-0259 TaxID=1920423 RepID=UPI000AB55CA9|nr:hypothetical protein [Paenibacillus sp. FSL H8-0259]